MGSKPHWDSRYISGAAPWDSPNPDHSLVSAVGKFGIKAGKTLELGCGTGTNSIWLATQGFDVLGIDISETAIGKAVKKRDLAGVDCRFMVLDFMSEPIPEAGFDFVFDRGFFHVFDTLEERMRCAEKVHQYAAEEAVWLSLIGSSEGLKPPFPPGPPRRSKQDILEAVTPYFEIISLESSHFGDAQGGGPKNRVCYMRKK